MFPSAKQCIQVRGKGRFKVRTVLAIRQIRRYAFTKWCIPSVSSFSKGVNLMIVAKSLAWQRTEIATHSCRTLAVGGPVSSKRRMSLKLCMYQSHTMRQEGCESRLSGSSWISRMMLASRTGTSWRRKMKLCCSDAALPRERFHDWSTSTCVYWVTNKRWLIIKTIKFGQVIKTNRWPATCWRAVQTTPHFFATSEKKQPPFPHIFSTHFLKTSAQDQVARNGQVTSCYKTWRLRQSSNTWSNTQWLTRVIIP